MKKGKDGKKTHTKELLATLFAIAVLGFLYLYVLAIVRPSTSPSIGQDATLVGDSVSMAPTNGSGIKKYRSDFMKIEFEYDDKFMINEKQTSGEIRIDGSDSKIEYGKYGTNYETIDDHLNNLIIKNSLNIENKQEANQNYKGIYYETRVDGEKENVYMFVNNYVVYYFSTKDPSLFPDLETIAKSFRIIE